MARYIAPDDTDRIDLADACPPAKLVTTCGDTSRDETSAQGRIFYCTRERGHAGPHVAHAPGPRAVATWPSAEQAIDEYGMAGVIMAEARAITDSTTTIAKRLTHPDISIEQQIAIARAVASCRAYAALIIDALHN